MHDNRVITEGRIERFVRDSLIPALYIESVPLTIAVWDDLDEPLPFSHAVAQSYQPIQLPYAWGKAWSTSWFHVTGQVPQEWLQGDNAKTRIELVIDLGFSHDRPGFQVEGLVGEPLRRRDRARRRSGRRCLRARRAARWRRSRPRAGTSGPRSRRGRARAAPPRPAAPAPRAPACARSAASRPAAPRRAAARPRARR